MRVDYQTACVKKDSGRVGRFHQTSVQSDQVTPQLKMGLATDVVGKVVEYHACSLLRSGSIEGWPYMALELNVAGHHTVQ